MKRNLLICLAGLCLLPAQIHCMWMAEKGANAASDGQQRTPEQQIEYVRAQAILLAKQALTKKFEEDVRVALLQFKAEEARMLAEAYSQMRELGAKFEQETMATFASLKNAPESVVVEQNLQPTGFRYYITLFKQVIARMRVFASRR